MSFSGVWDKKITDDIIESYFYVLRKYNEKQVQQAGYKSMERFKWFPKPADLVGLIETEKHDQEYREHFKPENAPNKIWPSVRCRDCGRTRMCILDNNRWLCRECYTGLTSDEINERYEKVIVALQAFRDKEM